MQTHADDPRPPAEKSADPKHLTNSVGNVNGDEAGRLAAVSAGAKGKRSDERATGRTSVRLAALVTVLVAALIIVALLVAWRADRSPPSLRWWQTAQIYHIYPRSFQDSDGDGTGDLKGITQRLDYLRHIGVDTLWLGPVYKSPMHDFGYDVENFTDVDPLFGTMADMEALLSAAHERGLRVLMDLVPNHSSDRHPWFKASVADPEGPYGDYYIWMDCEHSDTDDNTELPTNWIGSFGGSIWSYHPTRKQCFLHHFLPSQPDLNYRNPLVRREMQNVLRFWLGKGVDGFRVDAVAHLFEELNPLVDQKVADATLGKSAYGYLERDQHYNRPEVLGLVAEWRSVLDEYQPPYRFLMTEVYARPELLIGYYAAGTDFPINFELMTVNRSCGGSCMHRLVDGWLRWLPPGRTPNWVLSNHDQQRMSKRMGKEMKDAMNMLLLTLRGTPTTYYGEEIGMNDLDLEGFSFVSRDTTSPGAGTRDASRSPMQWSNRTSCAGFSDDNMCEKTWLPANPDYLTLNVETELEDPRSHLSVFRNLSKLRREMTFELGDMTHLYSDEDLYAFKRHFDGLRNYVVVINFGNATRRFDLREHDEFLQKWNCDVDVVVATSSIADVIGPLTKEGDGYVLPLKRGDGMVLTWSPLSCHVRHISDL